MDCSLCARCSSLISMLLCIALTASGVNVKMWLCDLVGRDCTLDVLPHSGLAKIVRWWTLGGPLVPSYNSLNGLSQMPTSACMWWWDSESDIPWSKMVVTHTCHLAHMLPHSQFTNDVRRSYRCSADMQTEVCTLYALQACTLYVLQAGTGSQPYNLRFSWI